MLKCRGKPIVQIHIHRLSCLSEQHLKDGCHHSRGIFSCFHLHSPCKTCSAMCFFGNRKRKRLFPLSYVFTANVFFHVLTDHLRTSGKVGFPSIVLKKPTSHLPSRSVSPFEIPSTTTILLVLVLSPSFAICFP